MCCWGLIARQDIPQPSTTPSVFGGVWKKVLLKSAGRCRLVIQLIQWRRATSVTVFFFFHFLILLPTRSQQRQESFLVTNAETVNSTAVGKLLFGDLVFVTVCARLAKKKKKKQNFLSTSTWANWLCLLHCNGKNIHFIPYAT